ncbi:DUF1365 domain-containing protein [Granulicella arctica]|uniref:DUF1365 domain-containing protein n=1 Tax=Granulicella arctica TaxID=940613 RepID=A0A7Y9PEV3_9BACT|nr:DUF1365 domain-containing protein [Granulicella arctica]NYF78616.1 hypothetical protein [Granulicella arctica]
MIVDSGIYVGTLRHRRWLPKKHEFTYPIFLSLLDIDRLPELMQVSRLTSYNKPNILSYREHDHFGDVQQPLRDRLHLDAVRHRVGAPNGPVRLLTHLRYCGYNFNPVSFFYCYGEDGGLHRMVAEVNNTFGETHNYWLGSAQEIHTAASKRYRFAKAFHVSPFMPADHTYDWTFTEPGDTLTVNCMNLEHGALAFDSTLRLERREWNPREIRRAILTYPFMTAKVIAAIHWQAMRLLIKRVPVVAHPGTTNFARRNSQDLGASWKTH